MAADNEVNIKFGATTDGVNAKVSEMAALFQAKFAEMSRAPELVSGKLKALAATLAAGFTLAAFTNLISKAAEAGGKLHDVAQQTGMTAEALSGLASVGKTSETSLEMIAGASNRLTAALAKQDEEGAGAAAALRSLGINFREFQAMSPDQRLMAVAKGMEEFRDGTGKTAAAMALFGRQGAQLLPFFADLAEQGELAAKMTTEQANAADTLGDNLVRLQANGEAWKKTLTNSMLPALADASTAFLDVFKQAGGLQDQIKKLAADGSIDRWTRQAITGLTYVADMFTVVKRTVVSLAEVLAAGLAQATVMVSAIADAFGKLAAGDMGGAVEAVKRGYSQMTGIGAQFLRDQEKQWSETTMGQRMRAAFENAAGADKSVKARPELNFKNASTDKGEADKTAAARLALQKALADASLALDLEYLKQAAAIYDTANGQGLLTLQQFYDAKLAIERRALQESLDTKRQELAEANKAAAGAGKEEQRLKFQAQAAKLQGEINILTAKEAEAVRANTEARKEAERVLAAELAGIRAQAAKAQADDAIAADAKALEQRRQLRQIDSETAFAEERALAARSYAATVEALNAKAQAIRGTDAEIQKQQAQVQAEREAAERAHQQRLGDIDRAAALERNKYSIQGQQSVQAGFAEMIRGLLSGTVRMSDALRSFAVKIAQTFENLIAQKLTDRLFDVTGVNKLLDRMFNAVANAVEEMVAKFVVGEATKVAATSASESAQTAAVVAGATTRTATETAASGTSKALTLGDAIMSIGAKAWESAANVYAAISAIPVVGPFLAPAAAVAAGAVVLGFAGRIASSAGGEYQVDRDRLNMVHKDETILPAGFATGLRNLVGNGGTSPLERALGDTQQATSEVGRLVMNWQGKGDDSAMARLQTLTSGQPLGGGRAWSLPANPMPRLVASAAGPAAAGGGFQAMVAAAGGAGAAAGGGGGGGPGVVNINITAMDGKDVRRMLIDNKQHLADAMRRANRDNTGGAS